MAKFRIPRLKKAYVLATPLELNFSSPKLDDSERFRIPSIPAVI